MKVHSSNTCLFLNKTVFLGGIFIIAINSALSAQRPSLEELPGLRERAVVMHIISRIVEENQNVVWDMENSKVTIPGRPVGIKLVSSDIVVAVQFTPFLRPSGQLVLVAQGQIWVNVPDEGISYRTTMQTIPLQWREQVYFFPLGPDKAPDEARIEIQLELQPYSEYSSESGRSRAAEQGSPPEGADPGNTGSGNNSPP